MNRIHILGASASGTTTLAKALYERTGYHHFDTDDYYWIKTDVPFTVAREVGERLAMLESDLTKPPKWILSGSLCGWGDGLIPYFDLVVFLSIPKEIRIKRLIERETQRYGAEIGQNGKRHQLHTEFVQWAFDYDEAGTHMRSRALHEAWLSKLPCPILRIEGDLSVEERVNTVLSML